MPPSDCCAAKGSSPVTSGPAPRPTGSRPCCVPSPRTSRPAPNSPARRPPWPPSARPAPKAPPTRKPSVSYESDASRRRVGLPGADASHRCAWASPRRWPAVRSAGSRSPRAPACCRDRSRSTSRTPRPPRPCPPRSLRAPSPPRPRTRCPGLPDARPARTLDRAGHARRLLALAEPRRLGRGRHRRHREERQPAAGRRQRWHGQRPVARQGGRLPRLPLGEARPGQAPQPGVRGARPGRGEDLL